MRYKKFFDPNKKPSQEVTKKFEKAVRNYKKMALIKKLREIFNGDEENS